VSTATTAKILGISRSHVCLLRRLFRRTGGATCADRELRGGRRHELMSPEEERAVVEKWLLESRSPGVATVAALRGRYETAAGRKVPRSTVYRVLSRLGVRPPNR
jgi:transposase